MSSLQEQYLRAIEEGAMDSKKYEVRLIVLGAANSVRPIGEEA